VIAYIGAHTTVAIERATLRLIGVDGIDEEGVPLPNRVVDSALGALGALAPLPGGILRPFVSAMLRSKLHAQATAEAIGRNEIALHELPYEDDVLATIDAEAKRLVKEGVTRLAGQILREAVTLLQEMDKLGLFKGLEAGLFADIKRSPEGGRGIEGVIKRSEGYFNPFYEELLG